MCRLASSVLSLQFGQALAGVATLGGIADGHDNFFEHVRSLLVGRVNRPHPNCVIARLASESLEVCDDASPKRAASSTAWVPPLMSAG
jgi:hypothetical protein